MKRTSKYVSETRYFWDVRLTFACTKRPKRRYLVVSEFITACLEESTLLDEEGKFLLSSGLSSGSRIFKEFVP